MIRIIDDPPREVALAQLREWQAEVDAVADYRDRIDTAKRLFKQKNRADNSTFRSVRAALRAMCGDAEWCCYCDCSQAAEIDHVRPKSLYPSAVFLWSNFLWVCGRCNKLKSNNFAIITSDQIKRLPRAPSTEPPDGEPALIDPRVEDPLDFLELDLYTFSLIPAYGLSGLGLERAEYTIEALGLDDEPLLTRRSDAYHMFASELEAYRNACERGDSPLRLAGYRARVRRHPHKIVWESMKRRPAELEPHVRALFEAAPECLAW
jgi:uncharacterized protein (TIGR02646 family)